MTTRMNQSGTGEVEILRAGAKDPIVVRLSASVARIAQVETEWARNVQNSADELASICLVQNHHIPREAIKEFGFSRVL